MSSPAIWCFASQRPSAFGIYMFSLCTGIALYLLIILPLVSACFLYALVCPYIFLLFDCFEWVLIDCIVKCRVHSALWQFETGGSISFTWVNLKIWAHLPFDASLHRRSMHCYFLISSYYLTVSNGCSLTTLKSVGVTQHSGSFKWGGSSILPGSVWKFELTCRLMLRFTEGLFVLHTKDLITTQQKMIGKTLAYHH